MILFISGLWFCSSGSTRRSSYWGKPRDQRPVRKKELKASTVNAKAQSPNPLPGPTIYPFMEPLWSLIVKWLFRVILFWRAGCCGAWVFADPLFVSFLHSNNFKHLKGTRSITPQSSVYLYSWVMYSRSGLACVSLSQRVPHTLPLWN